MLGICLLGTGPGFREKIQVTYMVHSGHSVKQHLFLYNESLSHLPAEFLAWPEFWTTAVTSLPSPAIADPSLCLVVTLVGAGPTPFISPKPFQHRLLSRADS